MNINDVIGQIQASADAGTDSLSVEPYELNVVIGDDEGNTYEIQEVVYDPNTKSIHITTEF
ncbi:hypothetical protein [Streptomyces hebeiensis]